MEIKGQEEIKKKIYIYRRDTKEIQHNCRPKEGNQKQITDKYLKL